MIDKHEATANNCTTLAAEDMRARLAKYEDAEGRPVVVVPEQAKEALDWIEDFIARCNGDDRGSCDSINVLRTALESQSREIDDLQEEVKTSDECLDMANEMVGKLKGRIAALKAQPSGVVLPLMAALESVVHDERVPNEVSQEVAAVLIEARRLNSSPVSAGVVDERTTFQEWYATPEAFKAGDSNGWRGIAWAAWQKRAALSAPSHGEQVREGWQLVPVEPTDAMLEAGDKYIGTPATYKSMLSACPSPAITKDFSQFLSAVMDAAGLIRHGRQSKELSEYLGMKCMEYRGAALSAPSHGEQVRAGWKLVPVEPNEAIRDAINLLCDDHSAFEDSDAFWSYLLAAAPSAGSQKEQGE